MPQSMDVANICFQFAIIYTDEKKLIGDMGIIFTNHENMQAEIGVHCIKIIKGKDMPQKH